MFVPNVGIGSTNPQAHLDVAGTIRANEICDESGLNCRDLSTSTGMGSVTSVVAGTGLTGGNITGAGTLHIDVGTAAGKIVQMIASGMLPAVNGSLLTNVNAVQLQTRNVASTAPAGDQVLTWNGSTNVWEPRAAAADNLGNHIATTNIQLGSNWLSGDGQNEGIFVASDGNVGIGTTVPGSALHVNGTVRLTQICDQAGGNCKTPAAMGGGSVTSVVAGTGLAGGNITGAGTISLSTTTQQNLWSGNGTDVYRTSGNVGIGTTSTTAKLSAAVEGTASASAIIDAYNSTDGRTAGVISLVKFGSAAASYGPYVANNVGLTAGFTNLLVGTETGHSVVFYSSNAERMRIDSGGNVGIGGASHASYKVDVAGTLNATEIRIGGIVLTSGIQGQVMTNATGGGACTTVGALGKDASGNLYVCDESPSLLIGSDCTNLGPGAVTFDAGGSMYVCAAE